MLVLDRKKGESILIDPNIEIKILKARGPIQIGIQAPLATKILRAELTRHKTKTSPATNDPSFPAN